MLDVVAHIGEYTLGKHCAFIIIPRPSLTPPTVHLW